MGAVRGASQTAALLGVVPPGTVAHAGVLQQQVLELTAQTVGGVAQAGGTVWGTGLALTPPGEAPGGQEGGGGQMSGGKKAIVCLYVCVPMQECE